MALNTYDDLHREIYDDVYALLECKDREFLRFAPVGTAEQVLHADKLRRWFNSLLEPGRTITDGFDVTEEVFITRVKERRLQPFLAVLIITACSVTTARAATAKLVADDDPPIGRKGTSICSLPADREDLEYLFDGNDADADKFLGKQAYFCPLVIRQREEMRVEDTEHRRLPYLEEQSLGKGASGHVFKVKIAKGHFYDPMGGSANVQPLVLARKDYPLLRDATMELETMEKIFASSTWECPNILKNMGSIAFGPNVYSLFMPLAICDLHAYMMNHHQARPNNIKERTEIIRCAMGLARGLHFLHNEMRTPQMERLVCYHMDMKPQNILIYGEIGTNRNIWKLSDFGHSRMKIHRSADGFRRELFVKRWWFTRASEPENSSVSGTKSRIPEGTYLAPESASPDRSMTAHSDVWSLGCILSVVFTYLDNGSEGVTQYAEERLNHHDALDSDGFFVSTRGFQATKVNPGVSKAHTRLVRRATDRSLGEGEVVNYALRWIENHVLQVDQFRRKHAKDVDTMLENAYKKYMKLTDEPCGVAEAPMKSGVERVWQKAIASINRRLKYTTDHSVDQWCLSEAEAFKGCQISPDCSFVAYWTDRKILFYSAQSLNSTRGDKIASVGKYTLETENYFWNSVRLTERYLVASTTSATFLCYIFDLEEEGGLNHCYIVELPQPAITKLAISPGSQLLVCAVRSSKDDRKPGSLLIMDLTEIIRTQSRLNPNAIPNRALHGQVAIKVPEIPTHSWWQRPLEWPAGAVGRLSFTTEDDIYFVVRPDATIANGKHAVFVVHINLATRNLQYMPLEAGGLDSSTARLFTALATFHRTPATCAIVTREKQLLICDLMADNSATPITKDIKNYRVLRLMMGPDDDKLYAVARQSANYTMVLVEITVPRSSKDEVHYREVAHLPDFSGDDQFTGKLSSADGGKSVLIASLVGSHDQRAIHRIGLE